VRMWYLSGVIVALASGLLAVACWGTHTPAPVNQGLAQSSPQAPPKIEMDANTSDAQHDDHTCPVVVKLLQVRPGKPPQKIYRASLQLRNRHSQPLWLLLRYSGDQALPGSGRFNGHAFEKQSFSSMLYTEKSGKERGQVIEVHFLGQETFTAFRLPPGGQLTFDNHVFSAFADIAEFEVWEVDALLVNGQKPVEQWLPYQVLSDQSVHLRRGENKTSLNWDKSINNYRQDYPDEKVDFVTAHAIKKCVVPLKK
jgi:hypothetical protein